MDATNAFVLDGSITTSSSHANSLSAGAEFVAAGSVSSEFKDGPSLDGCQVQESC